MKFPIQLLGDTVLLAIFCNSTFGQIYMAKEFSKDIALYRAKKFVIDEVFQNSTDPVRFEMDPLAASLSGEVTSLVYKCDQKNKEGLILGFFGNYWNDAGVDYQGYSFKDLSKEQAIELLNKTEKVLKENAEYFSEDYESNNVYFQFDDLTILISTTTTTRIRIFWKSFDADLDLTAFRRTKKGFERNMK